MKYKIIADSCCDLTQQLKEKLNICTVPLTMRLGEQEYIDDESLDLNDFIKKMKECVSRVGSSSPGPHAYQTAIEAAKDAFVITLSSKLSGSYSSAMMGKSHAEEAGGAAAHVFDSKSASAGETLIALKIHELIAQDMSKENIIAKINAFIGQMKTYFVLENYNNLQKNGRMSKITGKLASVLNIKLLMGADGNGEIAMYGKPRGTGQMIDKLLSLIKESGKKTDNESMVICHCNNPSLAERLSEAVKQHHNFKEIFIIPTRGLSSLYADDKGIIMAF